MILVCIIIVMIWIDGNLISRCNNVGIVMLYGRLVIIVVGVVVRFFWCRVRML